MQIITLDDKDFPHLLAAFHDGKEIGRYWSKGCAHVVCATRQFVLIGDSENPAKIAIKPARNIGEAERLALQFLSREQERGNEVSFEAN
ncbi:MAG: hypothetical protein KDD42_05790 [Bdellovibrionales bacterium]|nr:hypothetical protein [Bdellovibrionales bacterium]